MANKGKDTTNKALHDLLKNQAHPEKAPDDFEKEALEGFAMLGGEKEILEAKNKLDKRMVDEVLSKKGGSRKVTYWLAAAALLLIVGFAVYLVQNTDVSKPKDLAINESQKSEKIPILTEPTLGPAGAVNNEINKSKPIPVNPPPASEQTNPNTDAEDLSSSSAEKEASAVKTIKYTEVEGRGKLNDVGAAGSDDEKSLGAGQMKTEAKNQTVAAAAPQRSSEDINAASSSVAGNETGVQQQMSEVEVVSVKKSRAKRTKALSREESSSNCYFDGGEKALLKEIKQKLSQKSLLRKFDAVLFVNDVGKVEKVVLTNDSAFVANEQTEVIEILKTLDKFRFHTPKNNPGLTEYAIKFQP